jgi:hypothetical protein
MRTERILAKTLPSLGFYSGTLACTSECGIDTSGCSEFCGDGILQSAHEEMRRSGLWPKFLPVPWVLFGTLLHFLNAASTPPSALNSAATASSRARRGMRRKRTEFPILRIPGVLPGKLACGSDCLFDFSGCSGRCGDAIVQAEYEQCDGTNLDGHTCLLHGFSMGGSLTCSTACQFDENCLQVATISAGGNHTCALISNREMKCWGLNIYGQLGDNTNTQRTLPVPYPGWRTSIAIPWGENHSCALIRMDNEMLGEQYPRQLGDNRFIGKKIPN